MNRRSLYFKFFLILLLAAAAVYLVIPAGSKINLKPLHINYDQPVKLKLGLDLQGGSYLVYQGDLTNIDSGNRASAMESARDVIERRVNEFGVSEPLVQIRSEERRVGTECGARSA